MLSFTHLLILVLIILLFAGGARLTRAGRSIGEGVRQFKKGLRGEGDIDVTDSVKHLPADQDDGPRKKS